MAKYNVKHSCGCTVEHNLFGKSDYREYKIGKLEEEKCYNCQQNEKIEEKLNSGKYEIIEVPYGVYAEDRDSEIKSMVAVPDTYNKESKTIKVVVRKKDQEIKEILEAEEIINQELDILQIDNRYTLEGHTQEELNTKWLSMHAKIKNLIPDEKQAMILIEGVVNKKYNKKRFSSVIVDTGERRIVYEFELKR